jgi:(p)ppGpp synthase/HD superfamily hydrolase
MSHVTDAELVEIVPELRALALVETSADVRAALIRLADRYAALAEIQSSDQDILAFAA